jgi:hypothetical protein
MLTPTVSAIATSWSNQARCRARRPCASAQLAALRLASDFM